MEKELRFGHALARVGEENEAYYFLVAMNVQI